MTTRPITMSAPMARAILREIEAPGTGKTQTRRHIRIRGHRTFSEFGPSDTAGYDWHFRDAEKRWHDYRHADLLARLPYKAGNRLYVREHWRTWAAFDGSPPRDIPIDADIQYLADNPLSPWDSRFRHDRHMPRWASRITLLVTEVRVERLQSISRDDAIAEGLCLASQHIEQFWRWPEPMHERLWLSPVEAYRHLWNSLHGLDAWAANPWVMAVSFRPVAGNIDSIGGEA